MLERLDNWICDWLDGLCHAVQSPRWLRSRIIRLTLWQWRRFENTWGYGPLISNN